MPRNPQPAGSSANLSGASTQTPTFVADREGIYVVQLEVSDLIGPGTPDTVTIIASSATGFVQSQILFATDVVAELTAGQVTTSGNHNALLNFLRQTMVALQVDDLAEAINKLENAIARTDGCVVRSVPDGNGPGRDWITDCAAQVEVYDLLTRALDFLTSL